ncbi:MAG: MotA/TolQ/ExbB proton channel family protein [Flavobacteriales bacterium]
MSNNNSTADTLKSLFASGTIVIALAVAYLIYIYVLGNGANFEDNNNENHPINILGTIHKGGIAIVPILIAINLIVIAFSVERGITIAKAKGKGRITSFIKNVRSLLNANELNSAIAECDRQKGSLAAVIKSGLEKYQTVEKDPALNTEQKIESVQKELEEATALELPMLSKNLVILSTCASIATLVGLIGTVFGMIKAFSALAQAGSPDTVALATGISEALVNTALGIIASAVAIIMYNYYTNKIDAITYGMDEAGFSIVKTISIKGGK